jgi:hypothetical protein
MGDENVRTVGKFLGEFLSGGKKTKKGFGCFMAALLQQLYTTYFYTEEIKQ